MFDNIETHPSYGMLQFNRVSHSGGTALFGSSIQHKDTITMYLREGEVSRCLNNDHYFGHKQIVEVEKQARAEKQPKKKFELVQEIKLIQNKLEDTTND